MANKDPVREKANQKAYRESHREEIRARARLNAKLYRANNPEKVKAQEHARWEKHKEKRRTYNKEYYQVHRAEVDAAKKDWRESNRERYNASEKVRRMNLAPDKKEQRKAWNAAWRQANPDQIEDRRLRRKYGFGLDTWRAWHQSQGGVCPITGTPFEKGGKNANAPVVHHNHVTGHPEAIWSNAANKIEGFLLKSGDPIKILKRLLKYYEESALFHKK